MLSARTRISSAYHSFYTRASIYFIDSINRMEPSWTKDIQKRPICDFFYFLFVLRITLAVIVLVTLMITFAYMKKMPPGVSAIMIPFQLGVMVIAVIEALFLYVLCERTLPAK